MRPFWISLVALALLAGCTEAPPAAENESLSTTATGTGGAEAFQQLGQDNLPALRFEVGEYNATRTVEGSFPTPNTCFIQDCPEQALTFDLTADVPANAPVDLTLTVDSASCVNAMLTVEDSGSTRQFYASGLDGLALRLVRTAAGVVTLALSQCSILAGNLGDTTVPVSAELRVVVRPTVLPSYVPIALDLVAGDRLLGMGEDLEDLVIVPPGRDPIHLLGPFTFNVTDDLPAGRYVVLAKGGGEAMLHGTAQGGMEALIVKSQTTAPRAIVSGQEWIEEIALTGIPLYAGVMMNTQRNAEVSSAGAFMGDYAVTFRQDGTDLESYSETGCAVSCTGFTVLGYSSRSFPLGYLPEGLRPGSLSISITNQASNAYEASTYVGYVEP